MQSRVCVSPNMAGPSAHGQHNKVRTCVPRRHLAHWSLPRGWHASVPTLLQAHKPGRKAGASAREKHALKKQGVRHVSDQPLLARDPACSCVDVVCRTAEAKRRPVRAKGDTGVSRGPGTGGTQRRCSGTQHVTALRRELTACHVKCHETASPRQQCASAVRRQKHRHELLESRRQHGAPRLVALLPLSAVRSCPPPSLGLIVVQLHHGIVVLAAGGGRPALLGCTAGFV